MVQHGEYTGGALWYSKVRPAEVAEVVDGVGDTDLALGRGGAVIVGGIRPCVMQSWQVQSSTHSGSNTLQCTLYMTIFYPTHCPTHSQMLDFQNSDFIVLVHTNGLGYHQNAPFGKDSSIDFLWEVLSTLGLQGMEGEGRGQEGGVRREGRRGRGTVVQCSV